MNTLREIAQTLRVVLGSDALFSLVNARITLKTGLDLSNPDLGGNERPGATNEVISALTAMGYSMDTLRIIASKKGVNAQHQ